MNWHKLRNYFWTGWGSWFKQSGESLAKNYGEEKSLMIYNGQIRDSYRLRRDSHVCPCPIGAIITCHKMRHSLSLPTEILMITITMIYEYQNIMMKVVTNCLELLFKVFLVYIFHSMDHVVVQIVSAKRIARLI